MPVIDSDLIGKSRSAYFIGIGGVGMSALARVLKHRGLQVAGSDSRQSRTTQELAAGGIAVHIGQDRISFKNSDLIVYSSAISGEQLELKTARDRGLKIHHRAEILSSLLNQARTSVAVTGTHGKTTTSSMISYVLASLHKNPTCLVGGDVMNLGTNTILGSPDLWISEVDESDKSHELYAPNYAIVTNLEEDHMDNYRDMNELKNSFARFFLHPRNPGLLIYSEDDPVLRELVLATDRPRVSFGFSPAADFSAQNIKLSDFGSEFDFFETGLFSMRIRLSVPGLHNVSNSLAALALFIQLGIDPADAAHALYEFRGARRRLEIKWQSEDLIIIDDYAHHPTEVRASIRALRALDRRLTVVFQPHRFSRTRHFCKKFGNAFEEAEEVILTDIYSAGEANPDKISVDCIYQEMMSTGHTNVKMMPRNEILTYLQARRQADGVVAFLGAGDIGDLADEFAGRFKNLTAA